MVDLPVPPRPLKIKNTWYSALGSYNNQASLKRIGASRVSLPYLFYRKALARSLTSASGLYLCGKQ